MVHVLINISLFMIACSALSLSGCAAPSGSIQKLDDGSYLLRQEDHAGIFGSMGSLKSNVNREMTEFAEKENKMLEQLSEREHPVGLTARDWAWYEVRFKLRDPAAEQQADAKCDFKNNPSLQALSGKIALGGTSEQTFSHITNTSKPTDSEKAVISLYADAIRQCNNEQEKAYPNAPSSVAAVNHSSLSAIQNLLALLYSGNLTYGDYAKMTKEVSNNRETALAQIEQELRKNAVEADARAQQIAAQNAIAQSQASQAMSSSIMAGAAMANAYKPTVVAPAARTNISCTTSSVGYSLQTNCR